MTPSECLILAIYLEEKWLLKGLWQPAASNAARRCGVNPVRVLTVVEKARA